MKKLGFGLMRLPLHDADDPRSIDIERMKEMVDLFMERGFTYFDTAYPYHGGASEGAFSCGGAIPTPAVHHHEQDAVLAHQ